MVPPVQRFGRAVFINCPFDRDYLSCFEALTFAILACGFTPRCALETVDSTVSRLERIRAIVAGCRFGIHDLSRIETHPGLPRFNMPFVDYVTLARSWLAGS